jgi:hypothetical protein
MLWIKNGSGEANVVDINDNCCGYRMEMEKQMLLIKCMRRDAVKKEVQTTG